jgi:hypothetical protein
MTIVRKAKKGKFLNSLEKYYIFLASKQEIHMNEFNVNHGNPIYEMMYQKLKKYPIDSSKPTSPIPNKTGKHTIPHIILHRHTTKHTTQVSNIPQSYIIYTYNTYHI